MSAALTHYSPQDIETSRSKRYRSALTPSQLEHKRAHDRESQRLNRRKLKDHIADLEKEIEERRGSCGSSKIYQELLRRNRILEDQVAELKESLKAIPASPSASSQADLIDSSDWGSVRGSVPPPPLPPAAAPPKSLGSFARGCHACGSGSLSSTVTSAPAWPLNLGDNSAFLGSSDPLTEVSVPNTYASPPNGSLGAGNLGLYPFPAYGNACYSTSGVDDELRSGANAWKTDGLYDHWNPEGFRAGFGYQAMAWNKDIYNFQDVNAYDTKKMVQATTW